MGKSTIFEKGNIRATVFNGQLAGINYKGKEMFHGGALPDEMKTETDKLLWPGNSNITMFPIVGPTDNTYKIKAGDEEVFMDQHGIARIIGYEEKLTHKNISQLVQKYDAEKLLNPKHVKDPKRPKYVEFPNPYSIEQNIMIFNDMIWMKHKLRNKSDKDMDYNIGQHPCIKIEGNDEDVFIIKNQQEIKLEDLAKSPGRVIKLEDIQSVKYVNLKTNKGIKVSSKNYGHMMLWSPGKGDELTKRVCIEPVTELPNFENSHFAHGKHETLKPGQTKSYFMQFKPIE